MIREWLKEYKKNKIYIEVCENRIKLWEETLLSASDDLLNEMFDDTPESTLGMPRMKYKITSPVEQALINKEVKREKIRQLIENEKSRLFNVKYEVSQIESLMKVLNTEERFIIEKRFLDNWTTRQIEVSFNELYRKSVGAYISERRIQQKIKESIEKMENLIRI